MYQKEEEDLQRKLDKHIAENAEDWDIKNTVRGCSDVPQLPALTFVKQRRMLEESGKMITDSAERLGAVVQDLRDLLVRAMWTREWRNAVADIHVQLSAEKDPALADNEEVLKAKETLEEVSL